MSDENDNLLDSSDSSLSRGRSAARKISLREEPSTPSTWLSCGKSFDVRRLGNSGESENVRRYPKLQLPKVSIDDDSFSRKQDFSSWDCRSFLTDFNGRNIDYGPVSLDRDEELHKEQLKRIRDQGLANGMHHGTGEPSQSVRSKESSGETLKKVKRKERKIKLNKNANRILERSSARSKQFGGYISDSSVECIGVGWADQEDGFGSFGNSVRGSQFKSCGTVRKNSISSVDVHDIRIEIDGISETFDVDTLGNSIDVCGEQGNNIDIGIWKMQLLRMHEKLLGLTRKSRSINYWLELVALQEVIAASDGDVGTSELAEKQLELLDAACESSGGHSDFLGLHFLRRTIYGQRRGDRLFSGLLRFFRAALSMPVTDALIADIHAVIRGLASFSINCMRYMRKPGKELVSLFLLECSNIVNGKFSDHELKGSELDESTKSLANSILSTSFDSNLVILVTSQLLGGRTKCSLFMLQGIIYVALMNANSTLNELILKGWSHIDASSIQSENIQFILNVLKDFYLNHERDIFDSEDWLSLIDQWHAFGLGNKHTYDTYKELFNAVENSLNITQNNCMNEMKAEFARKESISSCNDMMGEDFTGNSNDKSVDEKHILMKVSFNIAPYLSFMNAEEAKDSLNWCSACKPATINRTKEECLNVRKECLDSIQKLLEAQQALGKAREKLSFVRKSDICTEISYESEGENVNEGENLMNAVQVVADAADQAQGAANLAEQLGRKYAAIDLRYRSPYDNDLLYKTGAQEDWDITESILRSAATYLASERLLPSLGDKNTTSASYRTLLSMMDLLQGPSIHRFSSASTFVQLAGLADTDGRRLNEMIYACSGLNDGLIDFGGLTVTRHDTLNTLSSTRPFSFWWHFSCIQAALMVDSRCRAVGCWLGFQKHLADAIDLRPTMSDESYRTSYSDTGDLLENVGGCSGRKALCARICSRAISVFNKDVFLLYCLCTLVPTSEIFRLILRQHEGEPWLWLAYASTHFNNAAEGFMKERSEQKVDSLSGVDQTGSKPGKPIRQARKVMLTCCNAFTFHTPIAASWAYLELFVHCAGGVYGPTFSWKSFPRDFWLMSLFCSKKTDTFNGRGCTRLCFEGAGTPAAAAAVALCSAEGAFSPFDGLCIILKKFKYDEINDSENVNTGGTQDMGDGREEILRRLTGARAVLCVRAETDMNKIYDSFPLGTSAPWAALYLALVIESFIESGTKKIMQLFEKHVPIIERTIEKNSFKSDDRISTTNNSDHLYCRKECISSCILEERRRAKEMFFSFYIFLLLANVGLSQEGNRQLDLQNICSVSKGFINRFPHNPFFVSIHALAQICLNDGKAAKDLFKNLLIGNSVNYFAENQLNNLHSFSSHNFESSFLCDIILDGCLKPMEVRRRMLSCLSRTSPVLDWGIFTSKDIYIGLNRLEYNNWNLCLKYVLGAPSIFHRESMLYVYSKALLISAGFRLDFCFLNNLSTASNLYKVSNYNYEIQNDINEDILDDLAHECLRSATLCPFSKRLWLLALIPLTKQYKKSTDSIGKENFFKPPDDVLDIVMEICQRHIKINFDLVAALATL